MEDITIKAECVLILHSKNEWVNKCPNWLPEKRYYGENFLFIDKNGYMCHNGGDFMEAEEKESYPIKVYSLKRVSEQ